MHQQQTVFENIVGKEEIALDEQFLLFPQCFLLNQIIVPHLFIFFTSYLYLLLNLKSLNPFPNKPWFLRVCSTSLLSNSPFPTVFSTCLENFQLLSSNLKFSSAKSLKLEGSKICRLGKG